MIVVVVVVVIVVVVEVVVVVVVAVVVVVVVVVVEVVVVVVAVVVWLAAAVRGLLNIHFYFYDSFLRISTFIPAHFFRIFFILLRTILLHIKTDGNKMLVPTR